MIPCKQSTKKGGISQKPPELARREQMNALSTCRSAPEVSFKARYKDLKFSGLSTG
jgi:hypothetical protein